MRTPASTSLVVLLGWVAACSVFGTGMANAYQLRLVTNQSGDLSPGDTLVVEVRLDSQSEAGAHLFSVSVLYPSDVLTYDRPASSTATYILYESLGMSSIGLYPYHQPALAWPLADDQVNVDWVINGINGGVTAVEEDVLVATLHFDVIGPGIGDVALSVDRSGNVFAVWDGGPELATVELGPPIPVQSVSTVPLLGALSLLVLSGCVVWLGRKKLVVAAAGGTAVLLASIGVGFVLFAFSPGSPSSAAEEALGGGGAGGVDTDGDGVLDQDDNCLLQANGPQLGACSQIDSDQDGYGNHCDTDHSNDGATGMDDWYLFRKFALGTYDPVYDYDCDGLIGFYEIDRIRYELRDFTIVGPSGLSCAGTVPCP